MKEEMQYGMTKTAWRGMSRSERREKMEAEIVTLKEKRKKARKIIRKREQYQFNWRKVKLVWFRASKVLSWLAVLLMLVGVIGCGIFVSMGKNRLGADVLAVGLIFGIWMAAIATLFRVLQDREYLMITCNLDGWVQVHEEQLEFEKKLAEFEAECRELDELREKFERLEKMILQELDGEFELVEKLHRHRVKVRLGPVKRKRKYKMTERGYKNLALALIRQTEMRSEQEKMIKDFETKLR